MPQAVLCVLTAVLMNFQSSGILNFRSCVNIEYAEISCPHVEEVYCTVPEMGNFPTQENLGGIHDLCHVYIGITSNICC
jgi:hypothetical protein